MSGSVAGKVWGIIIVQDVSGDQQTGTSTAKYLFLQEKPDQRYTVPCYDITAVSEATSHLEKTFFEVAAYITCIRYLVLFRT